jgi:hypothetical protein
VVNVSRRFGEHSRLWIQFSIAEFGCEPEDITRILGVEPTRQIHKGDIHRRTGRRQKFNLWSLQINTGSMDLDRLMDHLMRKLKNFKKLNAKFDDINAEVNAVLEIVGDDTRPTVTMSKEQINFLATMGISFSLAYYFFKKPLSKKQIGQRVSS